MGRLASAAKYGLMGVPVVGLGAATVPGANNFLSNWADDRVGDLKANFGIREAGNKRDPFIRLRDAGAAGDPAEVDAALKEVDPNNLNALERAEYRKYQRESESKQKSKEIDERGKEFDRLYGEKGLVTKLDERKFARDSALNREQIGAQKDIANIQGRNQFNIQGLANQGAADQTNLSGLWGFRQADRGALASENNTKVQSAANLISSIANTEAQREGQLLQAKTQRGQGLLNAITSNKQIGAGLIAAASGRRSFG